ncbi:MAG: GNAT family N-acetyltransferase [Thermomicrobiales bacterium]|jgi:predicted N-acetyltransferase YhbS|nr:GNAT family N-acetyltransferase [Thermomicrobiales bacterium]
MTSIAIREVTGEDYFETIGPLRGYSFGGTPGDTVPERFRGQLEAIAACRALVLFEEGVPRATAMCVPATQTLRGRVLPAAGLASVATHPAARRRGFQARVINEVFEGMRVAGQPVMSLYPSSETFYSRFGFIGFPSVSIARFASHRLAGAVTAELPGAVEYLPFNDGFPIWRSYLEHIQVGVHGLALAASPFSAGFVDRSDYWLAIARVDGEVVGAMPYTFQFGGELRADFLVPPGIGRYLLLQWLGRHADEVASMTLTLPPADRIETWLHDLRPSSGLLDFRDHLTPVARVVALDGIDGIHTGPGSFMVRVSDHRCPWNEGVWAFTSENGSLRVTPGGRPECDLKIEAISALVYGGYDPADFPFRGWGNVPPATAVAMRTMFPPALPYLYERF